MHATPLTCLFELRLGLRQGLLRRLLGRLFSHGVLGRWIPRKKPGRVGKKKHGGCLKARFWFLDVYFLKHGSVLGVAVV